MAKRRVPAALYNELTEYAALLRSLRVRDIMDVTKHMIKPSPFASVKKLSDDLDSNLDTDDDHSSEEDADDSHENSPVAGPSDLNHPTNLQLEFDYKRKHSKAKGKQKAQKKPKQPRRGHWTRWPLLLNDVLIPEWTLEDEVAVIASRVMKSRPKPVFPVPPSSLHANKEGQYNDDDDDDRLIRVMDTATDEDDPEPPMYVKYLSTIIEDYLSTLLGLLADNTRARPASMQNRVEPLNWRAVVDVVVSCDKAEFANSKVVENVIKRMECLYGPSIPPLEDPKATSSRVIERLKVKEDKKKTFQNLMKKLDDDYFKTESLVPSKRRSPSPLLPPPKKLSRAARKEARGYKARKPKVANKTKKVAMNQENDAEEEEDSVANSSPQPAVRRSTRKRTSTRYQEIPPENDGGSENSIMEE